MSWYNPGGGAGVWSAARVEPDLRNIIAQLCWAVNERELYTGARSTVTSITESGGLATVTATSHGLATGDRVLIIGAEDGEYNGIFQITVTGSNTFTYPVSGSPTSPAPGTIKYCKTCTAFTYNEDFDTKKFPAATDFDGMPLHKVSDAPELTLIGLTRAGTTATARVHGHGLMAGHYVTISGANETEYNGEHVITAIPSYMVSSITRSGSTATVTVSTPGGHNLATGDYIVIVGADQPEYNILATATVLDTTRFTYTVSGSPATPATGSISMIDQSRFQFDVDSAAATPATGTIKAVARASMIYKATWSGGTARIFCKKHGFTVGQYVEVVAEDSNDAGWQFWGPVTAISADEWFEIAQAATLDSELNHGVTGRAFWCSRVIGVRKPLKEIQNAIDGLLGRTISFVTNSSPYATAYTTSSLLGAGSYGSSWLTLMGRAVGEISSAVLQMKEAIDLLIRTTVTESSASLSSQSRHWSSTDSGIGEPIYTIQEYWDDAVGGATTGQLLGISGMLYRVGGAAAANVGVSSYHGVWLSYECNIDYTITPMLGDFVAGYVYFVETNNVSISGITYGGAAVKSQDSITIEDGDGDTFDLDSSLGATSTKSVPKLSSFFSQTSQSLTLTDNDLPATEPFDAETSGTDTGISHRYATLPVGGNPTHRHTRELVPGTHLTYG